MKSTRVKITHRAKQLSVAILCCNFVLAGCATRTASHNGGISATYSSENDKGKVISRLMKVGYSDEEAMARVDKMTDEEIVYLAGHPESVKRSGFVILSSLSSSSVWTTMDNKRNKETAEAQRIRDEEAAVERREILLELERRRSRDKEAAGAQQEAIEERRRILLELERRADAERENGKLDKEKAEQENEPDTKKKPEK